MSHVGSVRVSVTVDADAEQAFAVFTGEIDRWYRKGVSLLPIADKGTTLRFEPGVGGRLVEVGPDAGKVRARATVTVWEPGARLVFVDRRKTEVEVRFEPLGARTRVVLEHRGLDQLPPDQAASIAKHGWRRLALWFESYTEERSSP